MGSFFARFLPDDDEEEMEEPIQVELQDHLKVKFCVDDACVKAVKDEGYPDDTYWSNVKLIVMLLACLVASIAQFAPIEFPASKPLLALCVALYFSFSGLLQLFIWFVDKDIIATTLPRPNDEVGVGPNVGVRLSATFPKFQEMYTLTVERAPEKEEVGPLPSVSKSFSVGKIFTEDGELYYGGVQKIVRELLGELKEKLEKKTQ